MEQGWVWDWVGGVIKDNNEAKRGLKTGDLNPMNGVHGAKGT